MLRFAKQVHSSSSRASTAPRWLTAALVAALGLTATEAGAQHLRFSTTAAGRIVATGNTIGLSKALNENGPGTQDSIGTFISLDPNSYDDLPANPGNPWPAGTTSDWLASGSMGLLALPNGAEVLYAELVWGGSYDYVDNVIPFLDDYVVLTFAGDSEIVYPDAATAVTIDETSYTGFLAKYYTRSADVTAFVQAHAAGAYAVEEIPSTQNEAINSLNAGGWTLVVAYRSESEPVLRNLSIFVGGSFVDEDSEQDYTLSGFCAPPSGVVEGTAVVSALEGDADLVGDELLIAETAAGPFVNLSGPNNPTTNFFASQINGGDGQIDTLGSFGSHNHDAAAGSNVSGGRQGWDLTSVELSSVDGHLSNGQTDAVVRTTTTGDSYVPALVALELDVKSPDFSNSSTDADVNVVELGDSIVVTATLDNTGEAPANNLVFSMPIDSGLDLTGYSTDGADGDVNGAPVTEADLASGAAAGVLGINETRTIVLSFDVVAAPDNGASFVFIPLWEHSFTVCDGDPPISESHSPPSAVVQYQADPGTGGSGGSTSSGNQGGSGGSTSSSSGSGANSGVDNSIEDDGGCGCTLPGQDKRSWGGLAALAALGLAAARRRRR